MTKDAPRTLVRWMKFNFVGGIGIVVQLVVLLLLKSVLQFNYLTATALAVEAAVIHNFIWHERFTWADRTSRDRAKSAWCKSLLRFVRFNLTTGGVSVAGNLALMKLLVGMGHVNYLPANGIAIFLCSVANFLVSEQWVFQEEPALKPLMPQCSCSENSVSSGTSVGLSKSIL